MGDSPWLQPGVSATSSLQSFGDVSWPTGSVLNLSKNLFSYPEVSLLGLVQPGVNTKKKLC